MDLFYVGSLFEGLPVSVETATHEVEVVEVLLEVSDDCPLPDFECDDVHPSGWEFLRGLEGQIVVGGGGHVAGEVEVSSTGELFGDAGLVDTKPVPPQH